MADKSQIQWTEATWNPITGCTKVSDGCTHCYIDRTPPFRMAGRRFNGTHTGATTGVILHPDRLTIPLKWKKPRRIFVCSLADLFQDEVPDDYIAHVFATMALAPQHTFQVLTKRHGRMRSLLNSHTWWTRFSAEVAAQRNPGQPIAYNAAGPFLPNVWLGVSAENQQWADIRTPALLETPAAVRWLSCEPLLGPVDLSRWLTDPTFNRAYRVARCGQQSGHRRHVMEHGPDQPRNCPGTGGGAVGPRRLDWIVAGGESGPGSRPMHPDWARDLHNQCADAGVAYFCKQLGAMWGKANGADSHGGDWSKWPADLRIREYPETVAVAL